MSNPAIVSEYIRKKFPSWQRETDLMRSAKLRRCCFCCARV